MSEVPIILLAAGISFLFSSAVRYPKVAPELVLLASMLTLFFIRFFAGFR